MCGTWLIFLNSKLSCAKLYVIEIVGKIFVTENISIKRKSNEQVTPCDKYVLSDYKIR
jgi:hypothetical protein